MWVPPGYGELHARTVWFGTRETRLSSLVSKDRSYKPVVKSSGGQRESEGAIVVSIGVQNNAPGAKGPHFDRACVRSERQDMAAMRPNHPGGCKPVDSSVSEMVQHCHLPAGCASSATGARLWAAAKRPPGLRLRCAIDGLGRDDSLAGGMLAAGCRAGCIAAPGRPSVSRVRENRTHGSNGEGGNGLA